MRVLSHFLGLFLLASLLFGASHSSDAQVFRWADRFGAIDGQTYIDNAFDVVFSSDSSVYVSGTIQRDTAVVAGDTYALPVTTPYYGFFAKYDANGQGLWSKVILPVYGNNVYPPAPARVLTRGE